MLQKQWFVLSACHADLLADHLMPVGSGKYLYIILVLIEHTF